jgi:hypothetical protein
LQSGITSAIAQLDPEPQIPWLETFHLRSGVDALTGEPKVSALKRPTVPDKSLPNDGSAKANVVVEVIHGVHQQSRMHKFEGRGTVNSISPIALNASFAMQTSRLSSNHSFLVETIVFGEYDFENPTEPEDLELTSEALALSKTPGEFRKIHGDYFVMGFKRRYWFHALVECRYCNDRGNKPSRLICPFSKIESSVRRSNNRSLGKNSMAGSSRPPWTGGT